RRGRSSLRRTIEGSASARLRNTSWPPHCLSAFERSVTTLPLSRSAGGSAATTPTSSLPSRPSPHQPRRLTDPTLTLDHDRALPTSVDDHPRPDPLRTQTSSRSASAGTLD